MLRTVLKLRTCAESVTGSAGPEYEDVGTLLFEPVQFLRCPQQRRSVGV